VIRLAGALCAERWWSISQRYLTIESMAMLDAAQDQDSHTDNNKAEEVIALSAA
jgi:hypothetical protein